MKNRGWNNLDRKTRNTFLQFRREEDSALQHVRQNVPALRHASEKDFRPDVSTVHSLIKGDNLPGLIALHEHYENRVDFIYIDPPYNTGNRGFTYNDAYKGADGHSAWLSFMESRLIACRSLMSAEGVLCVSIDDNEQAYLKLLLDSIFGEENFMGDLIRKTKSTTNDIKNGFNTQHENTLVYCRDKKAFPGFRGNEKDLSGYKNPDGDPHGDWVSSDPTARSGTANMTFPITNPYTGKVDIPPVGRFWRFSKNTIQKYIDSGQLKFKETHKPQERGFIFKRYKEHLKNKYTNLDSLYLVDNRFLNQVGTREIKAMGFADKFTYPKSTAFIKELLRHYPKKDGVVLDFFAGSGTTGHATALLNHEDGGQRECLLITDAGKSETGGIDIADEVTYHRMIKALTGKEWADGKDHLDLEQGLLYYTVEDSLTPSPQQTSQWKNILEELSFTEQS